MSTIMDNNVANNTNNGIIEAQGQEMKYVLDLRPGNASYKGYVPTYSEIAEHFNVSKYTVSNAVRATKVQIGSARYEIRTYALEHGYTNDGRGNIRNGKQGTKVIGNRPVEDPVYEYLEHSNFPSNDVRDERMKRLRNQGCDNAEIAKAVGCCKRTVVKAIGEEPQIFADLDAEMNKRIEDLKAEYKQKKSQMYRQIEIESRKKAVAEAEQANKAVILQFDELKKLIEENQKKIDAINAEIMELEAV